MKLVKHKKLIGDEKSFFNIKAFHKFRLVGMFLIIYAKLEWKTTFFTSEEYCTLFYLYVCSFFIPKKSA